MWGIGSNHSVSVNETLALIEAKLNTGLTDVYASEVSSDGAVTPADLSDFLELES